MDHNKKLKSDLGNDTKLKNVEKDHVTGIKASDLRDADGDKRHDLKTQKQHREEEAAKNSTAG
jgi:hypothetical protein